MRLQTNAHLFSFNREGLLSNNVKIEAQVVPVSEEVPFSTYIEQTQVDLTRKQMEYAIHHQATGELLFGAQIGAYVAENGSITSPRQSDAGSIVKDLRDRNTAHLADYFSKMSESGDALQAAQAKAFLEKLAEYKPLAKVEEMEEQNFNMIDNTLNNLKKKEEPYRQEETKQPDGKYKSLRERLEEKKKIIASKESSLYVGPSLDL